MYHESNYNAKTAPTDLKAQLAPAAQKSRLTETSSGAYPRYDLATALAVQDRLLEDLQELVSQLVKRLDYTVPQRVPEGREGMSNPDDVKSEIVSTIDVHSDKIRVAIHALVNFLSGTDL